MRVGSIKENRNPVKQIYFFIACLSLSVAGHAEKGPKANVAKVSTQGCVQFKFNNSVPGVPQKDSVLIIFDKFDHTGAGVIYQVFYEDQDHNITLPEVPAGKYYVTIKCLGMHHDRVEKVVTIKSQKSEKVKINLQDSEEFFKDKVIIPEYKPDFSDLAVLKSK
jgi:hypothetical protein